MFKIIFSIILGISITSFAHVDHTSPNPLKAHLVYKNNTIHIHAELMQMPTPGQEAYMKLAVRNAKDHSLMNIPDQIDVVLWMPNMNHGSAPTQLSRATDTQGFVMDDQYLVSNMHFVMGGVWEIRITLTDGNGLKETRAFKLELPNTGTHH